MNGWQKLATALVGIIGIAAVAVTYIVVVPSSDDTTIVANVAIVSAALTAIATALFNALNE